MKSIHQQYKNCWNFLAETALEGKYPQNNDSHLYSFIKLLLPQLTIILHYKGSQHMQCPIHTLQKHLLSMPLKKPRMQYAFHSSLNSPPTKTCIMQQCSTCFVVALTFNPPLNPKVQYMLCCSIITFNPSKNPRLHYVQVLCMLQALFA